MILKRFKIKKNIGNVFYSNYEIPERYRNSFYLANAAFFDQVNWYLHRAYEICFPRLVTWLRDKENTLSQDEAIKKVTTVIEILDQCNSIIDVRFPIQLENGDKQMIRGFRAQHGLYSGFNTCLGGLRIKDDITRDHMKALSILSTYKHACMGIRLGGGHSGIKVDPTKYTKLELQRIVKKFAGELYMKGFCDGQNDILEPDINVGEQEMEWVASIFPDNYEKTMVVGKPTSLGGIENYSKMASQGVYFALDHFINNESILENINLSKGLENKTFIIQGIGNLGSALARFLENSGAVCIGIKEHDAQIYDPSGIDSNAVVKYKKAYGSILNFANAKPNSSDNILKESCDILILAAQQKSLICYIADKIKAKVIVEAANGAITPTAHRILTSKSKLVLPDIYVSSGHAIASYLEYLFVLQKSGKEIPVLRHLYKHILNTFDLTETTQIVATATTQKIVSCEMKPDVLTYAIDHVMKQTGEELIDIAKDFDLDLDLRIAGYIKAIQCMHESIYKIKRY